MKDAESILIHFISHEIPEEIAACVEGVFTVETDPEISYALLRECVAKLKKRHKELYAEYLETDDDSQ